MTGFTLPWWLGIVSVVYLSSVQIYLNFPPCSLFA